MTEGIFNTPEIFASSVALTLTSPADLKLVDVAGVITVYVR